MSHVFISYSRKDTEFVERLERDLNARGIVTWRDTSSIVGGEEWYKAIVRGIHEAYAVVQVVTPASDLSKWVLREGLYADQKGVPIISLLPEPNAMPFQLIAAQSVSCENYVEGFARLVTAVSVLRGKNSVGAKSSLSLGPTDRDTELAYLDFVLSEMNAELRTARYVSAGATRGNTVFQRASPDLLREFELSFDRFEPLVKAERLHGQDLDRGGGTVDYARDLLREIPRAIFLGEPGSGKTTTLQQLTIDLAHDAQKDPGARLPVYVPLRSFQGEESCAEFVGKQLGPLQSRFRWLRGDKRLILFFDALNEMPSSTYKRRLVDEVRIFLHGFRPWVLSCRECDYHSGKLNTLPEIGIVRLRPLELPSIKEVVDRRFRAKPAQAAALWYDLKGSDDLLAAWSAFKEAAEEAAFWEGLWSEKVEGERSPTGRAWQFMQSDKRGMMKLCRNPFLLHMVCETFRREQQLPPNRGRLFERFVANLLRAEEENSQTTGRLWIDNDIIVKALTEVAFAMQKHGTGTEIAWDEAEWLVGTLSDVNDPALLLRLAASASLIITGEMTRFTHQLLQEYFASEIMGRVMDEHRPATEFWPAANWWESQGWEETAIILAGVRGDPEGVARWVAPAQPEVAYQTLTECGVELQKIRTETRGALVASANAKTSEENPIGRTAAYRALSLLDADNRPGIGLREDGIPDLDWVEIPAGEFLYGDERERTGPTTLALPIFCIARYPITYAQFQPFLDAPDGFGRDEWWEGLTPEYQKQEMIEPYFKCPNHPRDNVSWYQAVAFCRWLSTRLGYDITLPSEQQWEKAARGTDGREYPWGNDYIPGYANIDETYGDAGPYFLQQRSSVGIYPQGASPYGVLDMAGNVWEWCSNEYENPDNTGLGSDAARVLRGGSWVYDHFRLATCGRRIWDNPSYRADGFGFRVVCSAPM